MGQGEELRAAVDSGGMGLLGTKCPLPLLLLFIMGEWALPLLTHAPGFEAAPGFLARSLSGSKASRTKEDLFCLVFFF